jgi:hydrogenase/urease accessory protein HupE
VGSVTSLVLTPVLNAHEIGTTRVVASFGHDDTYLFTVTADASATLGQLERAVKQPPGTPSSAAEYQRAFDALCEQVPSQVSVTFDAIASTPRASCTVDPQSAVASDPFSVLGVTIALRGAIPPGAATFRWRYGLTFASYALSVQRDRSAAAETVWLDGTDESGPLQIVRAESPLSRAGVARQYFGLGFIHIVPKGLDHILFVLGLYLLSRRLRPILWQVSAFTLAHSITLGLTLYGLIALRSSIVEPLIALSIVYVAVENLFTSELKPWRVALVFGFGLLHGMGFAGALQQLALPRSEFLTGLVAFNAGVEAGQLVVIATAFVAVGAWARRRDDYRRMIVVPGSAAIALTGLFWTVQRLGS